MPLADGCGHLKDADLDKVPGVRIPLVDLLVATASHDDILLVIIWMKPAQKERPVRTAVPGERLSRTCLVLFQSCCDLPRCHARQGSLS